MRLLRTIGSFWRIAYSASTLRRFGYAILALPLSVVCLLLALTGQAQAAARYQRRLASVPVGEAGSPQRGAPAPRRMGARVAAHAVASLPLGLACWAVLQFLRGRPASAAVAPGTCGLFQVGVGEEAVEDGLVAADLDGAVAAAPEQQEQVGGGSPGGGVALGVTAAGLQLVPGRGDEPFALGVGGVEVHRAVERGGALGLVGREELEELVDAVDGEGGVDLAGRAAGKLGVDAVDDGLLRHAPPHEAGVLLGRPGPDRGRRVGGGQDAGQPFQAGAVPGEQLAVWRAGQRALHLGAVGGALLDDAPPEVVHPADVPDEVADGPARAGGDRRLRAGALGRIGEQGSFAPQRRDVVL